MIIINNMSCIQYT